jgi:hypothetical protein
LKSIKNERALVTKSERNINDFAKSDAKFDPCGKFNEFLFFRKLSVLFLSYADTQNLIYRFFSKFFN